jgi:predicted PurR-regulated permease PerM
MKRLAKVTALILMTVGGVVLLWLFSNTVLLFLLSLVIAAAVRPLAERLIDRGINRSLAYGLAYLTGLLCLISLIVVAGSGLLAELEKAGNQLLEAYTYVTVQWPNGEMWQQRIASELPAQKELIEVLAGEQGTSFFRGIIGFGSGVFDLLAQVVVVLSLSVYWATDRERFERLWLSLVHAKYRPRARTIWRSIELEVGAYVRSEVTQSSLAGITLGLAYAALGLPYPILLALWAALVWLIPWVGVVLALIPAALVGLLVGWQYAILAALITIVVFGLMETWLEPRLYGRSRVSPVLVVITLMMMAQYAGILGMLLAPPLAATLQILGREIWFTPTPKVTAPDLTAQLVDLRSRLAALRLEQNVDFATNVQARSLASRIQALLDKTHETLDDSGLMPPLDPTPTLDPALTQNANPTPATQ